MGKKDGRGRGKHIRRGKVDKGGEGGGQGEMGTSSHSTQGINVHFAMDGENVGEKEK